MTKKKRARRRASRRRNQRNRASSRSGPSIDSFVCAGGVLTPAEEQALRRVVPRGRVPMDSSAWLLSAVDRAGADQDPLELLALIGRLLEWCYRAGADQLDCAVQLANVEHLRRHRGAPAQILELPELVRAGAKSGRQVRLELAACEAGSLTAWLLDPGDSEATALALQAITLPLVLHLAEADGVPARFERLDPSRFAAELATAPGVAGGIERPPGYAGWMLGQTADLYQELGHQGRLDERTATEKADALRALAVALMGFGRAA